MTIPPMTSVPGESASDRGHPEAAAELFGRVRNEALFLTSNPLITGDYTRKARSTIRGLLKAGKRVRIIYGTEAAETRDAGALFEEIELGAEIRVTDARICNTAILDESAGLFWRSDAGDPFRSSFLLRDEALLSPFCDVAGALWEAASDLRLRWRFTPAELDGLTGSVLAALGEGLKDEVAARRLQISVRTYRRHVAEIMERLETTSRFQAGVHSAALGLTRPVRSASPAVR